MSSLQVILYDSDWNPQADLQVAKQRRAKRLMMLAVVDNSETQGWLGGRNDEGAWGGRRVKQRLAFRNADVVAGGAWSGTMR